MHTLTSGQWERLRRTLMAQTTAGSRLLSVGRLANDCLVFTVRTRRGENIPIRIATDGRPLIDGRPANQMTRPTRILFTFTQKETAMTQPPPLVMTLTLPEGSESEEATLLLQRGSFAHLTTFAYLSLADVTAALQDAQRQLTALEASPPILPAVVSTAPRSVSVKPAPTPKAADSLTIPVGKKTRTIPSHHLHAPPNQQAQAITIAGRLLAGGLWDGISPIRVTDAARTLKALRPLSDKDLTLFSLTDFVEVGPPEVLPEADDGEDAEERQVPEMPPMTWQVGDTVPLVSDAMDEDGEPVPFDAGRIVEIDVGAAGPRLWLESPDGDHDVWVRCDQLAAV